MATGIFVPNDPKFVGHELTESYEDISIDPEDYEGQSVMIIGRQLQEQQLGLLLLTGVRHL